MVTVPFIHDNPKTDAKGVKINLANQNCESEYYEHYHLKTYNSSGLYIAGIFNLYNNFKGCEIAGLFNSIYGNMNGISVGGLANYIEGDLKGVSVSGVCNYAKKNAGFSVQIGLFNVIDHYNSDGTVIQLGLYNRAEEQSIPFLNIRRKQKGLEKKL